LVSELAATATAGATSVVASANATAISLFIVYSSRLVVMTGFA
jgi:hypothetical protein